MAKAKEADKKYISIGDSIISNSEVLIKEFGISEYQKVLKGFGPFTLKSMLSFLKEQNLLVQQKESK